MKLKSILSVIFLTISVMLPLTAASSQVRYSLQQPTGEVTKNLFISCADGLIGYIAVSEFLSNFKSAPAPVPPTISLLLNPFSANETQHPYASIFCGVTDPDSEHSKIVSKFGCKLVQIPNTSSKDPIKSALSPLRVTHVLLIPPILERLDEIGKNYVAAAEELDTVKHIVLWSRVGSELGKKYLGMFHDVEQFLSNYSAKKVKMYTILKLSFAMERFLDFAQFLQDDSMIPLPIGTGSFVPISLHDAALATHIIFSASPSHHGKIYNLNGPHLLTGNTLALHASHVLHHHYRYEDVPESEALEMYSDLENFDPILVHVLLDTFNLIKEGKLADLSLDGEMLLGRKLKCVKWFWQRFRDYFRPGGF